MKFTPYLDRENPDEQLHSEGFSVERKKIFLHSNCRNNEN